MIYENVELHNVAEAVRVDGRDGVRLQRVPEEVRLQLEPGAQLMTLRPDNCEVRFRCDGSTTRVTLSSEGESKVTVFLGPYRNGRSLVVGPEPQTIEVTMSDRLQQLDRRYWANSPFSPQLFRLIFGGKQRDRVYFHGAEGDNLRPPEAGDLPQLRYLAYGTSITHGFDAEMPHLSYVAQTARALGADLINLGVAGSAHCERAFSDYIAKRTDWDIASLELSTNMHSFPMDEFYRRVSYMVNTVAGSDTSRLVACITLYPYFRDWGIEPPGTYGGTPEEYRQALREAVEACPYPNVHLIEGPEILTDMTGLTADLVHPSDDGMIEMGRNLAARLKTLLK